jgi:Protein of unknown function (DUF2911)
MKLHKSYIAIGLVIAFALFCAIAAYADEANQQIKLTFNKAVEIPGQVLPAGTYTFQLAAPDDDQNLVQIFDADQRVLYATLPTVPTERAQATADVSVTLAESNTEKAGVLLKFFYPGRLTGHELVYSNQEEKGLAQTKPETFVGGELVSNAGTPAE